jgi:hypothetical protein
MLLLLNLHMTALSPKLLSTVQYYPFHRRYVLSTEQNYPGRHRNSLIRCLSLLTILDSFLNKHLCF